MQVTIQFTEREELRALATLLRHSPGRILPGRRYVVDEAVPGLLRTLGVRFKMVGPKTSSSDESKER